MHLYKSDAVTQDEGVSRGVREALADPIVQALLAADRVNPQDVADLSRRIAARLDPQQGAIMMTERVDSCRAVASRGLGYARSFAVAAAVIAGLSWAPHPAAAEDAPAAFIGSLGQQVLAVIRRPDLPLAGKAAYFRQLLRQDFDMTGISRFVLGSYWRVASPRERQAFSDLLTQRLVEVYGRRLAQAGDGDFVVSASRTEPDSIVVTSRIIPRQGAPIAVDWRLGVSGGHYAIEDVAIDGVSMALAERSEIAARISRDGGQLGLLLAEMRGLG